MMDYIPYGLGLEWEKELMQLEKKELIQMIRNLCTKYTPGIQIPTHENGTVGSKQCETCGGNKLTCGCNTLGPDSSGGGG